MGRERPKNDENVKVVVRCRPMNPKEKGARHKFAITVDEDSGRIDVDDGASGRPFSFDHSFGYSSKQETQQIDIYNLVARPIVDSVLEGYNGTIFAYGQTGTGKTFTMEGIRSEPSKRGIIPNSFAHIFGHITKSAASKGVEWLVQVSYLEIYQENIRDLLKERKEVHHLELKEHPETGVYVKDLSKYVACNADELNTIMTKGNKNRVTGATNMNEHSSRSHAIFSIRVERQELGPDGKTHFRVGKLNLVDLAGSERQSKTGAQGTRLKEATKINLSLSTLGNVISALVDTRNKTGFIPYRNSKLTRLLQDSLGGNSKTLMIANIGPSAYNIDETMSTLRYANNAKRIKNKAKINEDPKDALLRRFQQEIEELKRKLADGEGLSDDGEEVIDEATGQPVRRSRRRRTFRSKEQIDDAQEAIEKERRALRVDVKMAEEDKRKAEKLLGEREGELATERDENDKLETKLKKLQQGLIKGGENLLEKHDAQEKLLNEANVEIEGRKKKIDKTRTDIENLRQEAVDVQEQYKTLEEECIGKTKKLKKVFTMLYAAKGELDDMNANHAREMEALVESCQDLNQQNGLAQLIVESFIPEDYLHQIQNYVIWNDSIGEWQLKGIAYAGNNMMLSQKQIERAREADEKEAEESTLDLTGVYMAYSEESFHRTINRSHEQGLLSSEIASSPQAKAARKRTAVERKRQKAAQMMDSVLNN